jgi:hypothetical protein
MSVQSLSVMTVSERDGTAPAPEASIDSMDRKRDEERKLDALVGEAMDRVESQGAQAVADDPDLPKHDAPDLRGEALDKLIENKLARIDESYLAANKTPETVARSDFGRSRETRNEMARRHDAASIGQILDTFKGLAERLTANPAVAANELADTYLKMPPLLPAEEKVAPDKDEHPWKKLDRLVSDSIDDAKEFTATKEQREWLTRVTGKPFDQALAQLMEWDSALRADPYGAALKIAANFGAPVSPIAQLQEQQQAQFVNNVQAVAQRYEPHLPGISGQMQPAMVAVLHHPYFEHGPNPEVNMLRAYQTAYDAGLYANQRGISFEQALNERAQQAMNLELQGEIAQFAHVMGKDQFDQHRFDMAQRLQSGKANSLAEAYEQAVQARVAKARRASPVRSSGTVSRGSTRGGDLDSVIRGAMARVGY